MEISKYSLPTHGRLQCSRCFDGPVVWGHTRIEDDGWRLLNNPMSWGASDPRFLLLGFSKGSRQADIALTAPHEAVPFNGFRPRLDEGLRLLGLFDANETVDQHLHANEQDWAFGSIVRCTVEKKNLGTGKFEKSGDIIPASAKRGAGKDWIGQCVSQHLSILTQRLETVILLSNDDAYVDACFNALHATHPQIRRINDVSYGDCQTIWVHIVHFGGQGFNHMQSWLSGSANRQGDKMRAAKAALAAR